MTEPTSRKIRVTERRFLWVQDDDEGEVPQQMVELGDSPCAASKRLVDAAELETQRNLRELEVMALPAVQALRAKFSATIEGEEKAQ